VAEFNWPEDCLPERSQVHVRNELRIAAPPETVWAWLVKAERWPSFYRNSARVRVDGGGDLRPGVAFTWWTFGSRVKSYIREFEPPSRIAWDAKELGAAGYHAWLLKPDGDGTHVVTEETQHGPSMRVAGFLLTPAMRHFHQRWLEGLGRVARAGPPASSHRAFEVI
jgi:uncharacterized protein YndB with AHSA1/START domain